MSRRLPRLLLFAYAAAVIAFLVAPILAIVPLSFNGGSFLAYPLDGLSLRWYQEAFGDSSVVSNVTASQANTGRSNAVRGQAALRRQRRTIQIPRPSTGTSQSSTPSGKILML